jgi:hypothetical protein
MAFARTAMPAISTVAHAKPLCTPEHTAARGGDNDCVLQEPYDGPARSDSLGPSPAGLPAVLPLNDPQCRQRDLAFPILRPVVSTARCNPPPLTLRRSMPRVAPPVRTQADDENPLGSGAFEEPQTPACSSLPSEQHQDVQAADESCP